MKLLTKAIREHMLRNGRCASGTRKPVVKLFTPDGNATWLLSELDPDEPDLAFGLCDLGQGFPELGYVRISELERVRGRFGLPVERDLHFEAKHTLLEYADMAFKSGHLTY